MQNAEGNSSHFMSFTAKATRIFVAACMAAVAFAAVTPEAQAKSQELSLNNAIDAICDQVAEEQAAEAAAIEAAKPNNIAVAAAWEIEAQDVYYRYGGSTPAGFDCSGFTMWCYAQAGIDLPHNAAAQYNCGEHVDYDDLQPGDLVFFGYGRGITHAGIYIGDGNMIHSPSYGRTVSVEGVLEHGRFVGGCRLV